LPLKADGALNYDLAMPMLLVHYFPHGLLGLGITALFASFMSGMAGNVSAFNTVWTYDIYQAYLRSGASDRHYLNMGRIATVVGVCLSVAAAYVANRFNNIMDMLQLLFAFVNAPLFATFLLGMFWKARDRSRCVLRFAGRQSCSSVASRDSRCRAVRRAA
jgi:SSS family solute:Na+ symporter